MCLELIVLFIVSNSFSLSLCLAACQIKVLLARLLRGSAGIIILVPAIMLLLLASWPFSFVLVSYSKTLLWSSSTSLAS